MAERLDAADAWFLYLENPSVHLHVTGVLLLDPTGVDDFSFALVRRHVLERLDRLPALRLRLAEVPLGIDHPEFVRDPDFDLDHHLRAHRLPKRGSMADLGAFVGRFASQQLDRSRPLWEMVHVDGLAGGRTALVMKLHHCLVDGVTGVEIMADLLDPDPVSAPPAPGPPWEAEALPSSTRVVTDAVLHRLATPLRPARAAVGTASALARVAGTSVGRRVRGDQTLARPLDAPRTIFNGSLTPRRSVAFGQLSLDEVKAVRHRFGTTVNDVVLAAVTHGVRGYLAARDDLPDRPLVCSVPVSVHRGGANTANQVSNMFVHLPVQLADPVERLRAIHEGAVGAKEMQGAVGTHVIADVVELVPPWLFHRAARLWSDARLAERLPPVHNIVVSNVPGSPVPLYFAGARLDGVYPFGPLMEGAAVNITVLSNVADMDVGIIACPDLVPRLGELMAGIVKGVDVLLAA